MKSNKKNGDGLILFLKMDYMDLFYLLKKTLTSEKL